MTSDNKVLHEGARLALALLASNTVENRMAMRQWAVAARSRSLSETPSEDTQRLDWADDNCMVIAKQGDPGKCVIWISFDMDVPPSGASPTAREAIDAARRSSSAPETPE